ncbi:MAG: glycine betaine ABC transporter substrate-binding protein, partial [Chloroflexota bacterium]|nr:glycine betaine ABC transporter substrate-binding protein [Chloroflexota bacterium]
VYDKYPELPSILDPVFESLDLQTLQSLNAKIQLEGRNPADVARDYLVSKGFLK